jgi:hypothetical protein
MASGQVTRRSADFKLPVDSDRGAWVITNLLLRVTILIHEHEAERDPSIGLTPRDPEN